MDDDGYLTLTGCLEELNKRGGGKFASVEIDNVFLEPPDLERAMSCAVPRPKLGGPTGNCSAPIFGRRCNGASSDPPQAASGTRLQRTLPGASPGATRVTVAPTSPSASVIATSSPRARLAESCTIRPSAAVTIA